MDCLHSATERFRVTQEQASSRRSFSWQFHIVPTENPVRCARGLVVRGMGISRAGVTCSSL
jgi:hypothetical protein